MTELKVRRLQEMLECLDRAGAAGMTRREFAECMNLKVTPYLTSLLDTLIEHGYAFKQQDLSAYPPPWRYYPTSTGANTHE